MKPCNSSSHKQTRFRGNQIHLPSRHLDVLTVYSSCKLKTRQGIKLAFVIITFYSDSFVARKINVEQKVAENWAPYCAKNFINSTQKKFSTLTMGYKTTILFCQNSCLLASFFCFANLVKIPPS